MKGHGAAVLAGAGALVAAAAGCGAAQGAQGTSGAQGDGADLPSRVVCEVSYRADDSGAGQRDATLEAERTDGMAGAEDSAGFDEMSVALTYIGEAPEGRVVSVDVTDAAGDRIARDLYQLGTPAVQDIEFSGGHGFTGLSYVHSGEATLQYWCTAEE
ncbi:hypothetical protein O4J56_12960 [Nocardiopsis sp. RSe5-2]|uniref:Lipoprotein n=1 Tax=Nocardiopsis endophytica TaxID=3018445 RepID=A0ABT4U3L7_9ACTN|nr:hypothetical protein [Nocardiopsis endophytica]MDA2811544.1 hypothetical protein [Nocardiopsis endophytica]